MLMAQLTQLIQADQQIHLKISKMTTYIVIDIETQTRLIDFSQVNTTSSQTMPRNLANTQAMIGYQVTPSFITNGSVDPLATLNQDEAVALLATPEWSPDEPEPGE